MPAGSFNATAWAPGTAPEAMLTNAEIVRCTVSGDTVTIARAQEGTTAQSIAVGWYLANTATAKFPSPHS